MRRPSTTPLHAAADAAARDALYARPQAPVADFNFGPQTAAVFDDMVQRSVPFYDEIQRMIAELAGDFAVDGTNVYDLGCSTGATLRALASLDAAVTLIGIDRSAAMLARADAALRSHERGPRAVLRQQDLDQPLVIENASVVILSLTLQFVRPVHRERLLRAIHAGLNPHGCLILVEKVLGDDPRTNRLFIEHHHAYKRRNGYNDLEIAQKREALENVLVPYRLEENRELLRASGFAASEIFFKWYNFCGLLAVK